MAKKTAKKTAAKKTAAKKSARPKTATKTKTSGKYVYLFGKKTDGNGTMKALLGRAYIKAKEHAGKGGTTDVDSATKERLKALGYAE